MDDMWRIAVLLWFSAALVFLFYYAGFVTDNEVNGWSLIVVLPIALVLVGAACACIAAAEDLDPDA